MTYQEANHISIKDYLKSLGILPAVDKYYYGMYHSPFRQDDTPSFKVDYGVNLWCDFGTVLSADWNSIHPEILFLFKGKRFQKGFSMKGNNRPAR